MGGQADTRIDLDRFYFGAVGDAKQRGIRVSVQIGMEP